MSIITKTAAVLAATGALLGLGCLTSTANASSVGTARSQGFHIYNMTGDPLTLKNIAGDKQFEGAPKLGSVLQPGETSTFEVKWVNTFYDQDTIRYTGPQGSVVDIRLAVEGGSIATSQCVLAKGYECSRAYLHQKDIVISDKANTVHEVSGDQAQKQAELVRQLCHDGTLASCDFSPDSQVETFGPSRFIGSMENRTSHAQELDIDKKQTVESKNSFDISIEVGSKFTVFGEEVDVAIKTKYGHEWSTANEVSVKTKAHVQPGWTTTVWGRDPIRRVTGTLTVALSNTTWVLHDVHFDQALDNGKVSTTVTEAPNLADVARPHQS